MSPCRHVVMSTCRRHVDMFICARIVLSLPKRAHVDWNWLISRDKDLNKDWSVKMPLHWRIRELKKTTTATTTPLNKRSNEQNNSCARALQFMIHFFYEAVLVSKLRWHFIVLILHFMLYFSHLMLISCIFIVCCELIVRIHFVKVL